MTTFTERPMKLPGTRPAGALNEREASARVREMFGSIAPRYDFLNHFLSFSLDRVWRLRTARKFRRILRRTDARVLDLCCGTGDLTFALERVRVHEIRDRGAYRTPLFGSDFARPMLERAHKKAEDQARSTVFAAADALQLPYADRCFDLVTTAFGFRNLVNYRNGLREIARVLKPGGEVGILEFSEPGAGPMAGLFRFYFQRILPKVGKIISGGNEAYSYLPKSVSRFPSPQELAVLMQQVGFIDVSVTSWNFNSVILHTARWPKAEVRGTAAASN
ncbi:MAG: bifunctional demethylmenaquinone methyltransferase/2-methoxy-6-polyprenyl-1,4-benzoquinol methylase UbiE [Candidatus Acidiferrales bacterium]